MSQGFKSYGVLKFVFTTTISCQLNIEIFEFSFSASNMLNLSIFVAIFVLAGRGRGRSSDITEDFCAAVDVQNCGCGGFCMTSVFQKKFKIASVSISAALAHTVDEGLIIIIVEYPNG